MTIKSTTIRWLKNGLPFSNKQKIILRKVSLKDQGNYSCEGYNKKEYKVKFITIIIVASKLVLILIKKI